VSNNWRGPEAKKNFGASGRGIGGGNWQGFADKDDRQSLREIGKGLRTRIGGKVWVEIGKGLRTRMTGKF